MQMQRLRTQAFRETIEAPRGGRPENPLRSSTSPGSGGMMLQRKVLSVTLNVSPTKNGFVLQVSRREIESTLSRGRVVTEHERYEELSYGELLEVIDQEMSARMPGSVHEDPPTNQLSLLAV